jgi:hypothetical protein
MNNIPGNGQFRVQVSDRTFMWLLCGLVFIIWPGATAVAALNFIPAPYLTLCFALLLLAVGASLQTIASLKVFWEVQKQVAVANRDRYYRDNRIVLFGWSSAGTGAWLAFFLQVFSIFVQKS